MGVNQIPKPIFFQNGRKDLHLVTNKCEIMTWSMTTGKLKSSIKLPNNELDGYHKPSKSVEYRNRVLLVKEIKNPNNEEIISYKLVEIVSACEVKVYAEFTHPLVNQKIQHFFLNDDCTLVNYRVNQGASHSDKIFALENH
jgi:hypothetical protein